MKTTTLEAVKTLEILDIMNFAKLTIAEKSTLLSATCTLRKIRSDWEKMLEEANKKCRPEGWTDMMGKVRAVRGNPEGQHTEAVRAVEKEFEALGEAERKAVIEAVEAYDKEVYGVMEPEMQKVHEIELPGITAETMTRIAESNPDWTLGAVASLQERLIGE